MPSTALQPSQLFPTPWHAFNYPKNRQGIRIKSDLFSPLPKPLLNIVNLFSTSFQPLFNLFSTSFQPLFNLFSTSSDLFSSLCNLFTTPSQPLLKFSHLFSTSLLFFASCSQPFHSPSLTFSYLLSLLLNLLCSALLCSSLLNSTLLFATSLLLSTLLYSILLDVELTLLHPQLGVSLRNFFWSYPGS